MNIHYLASLAFLALPLTALAVEPGPSSPQQQETENWLTLQVSGQVASPILQQTTPAEREQAMQRWLDSNKHPIPEYFDQKAGGDTSGGSH
ncbi:DUF3613 domain-containing protein [Pseudomonas fluorescens]|uniref:DUF3613 domain-containing protein n=1 Tax=Pseudomonas fluorescens TaxID=294 RepID=UPI001BE9AE71|nr:DUF3613 domain-containing protein [Pseudomonas fluorescens]MBT2375122.1 DUF3613 domain-containing protein [Pseudomonas fluorescens]